MESRRLYTFVPTAISLATLASVWWLAVQPTDVNPSLRRGLMRSNCLTPTMTTHGPDAATSGRVFSMDKIRTYAGVPVSNWRLDSANPLPPLGPMCDRWAVMTTIFAPSSAARDVAALKGWCLVVVGDQKSAGFPLTDFQGHVVYLSAQDQENLPYRIIQRLPWNHFGRKNVGYIYALHHGAQMLYDFDDDNILTERAKISSPLVNASVAKAKLVFPEALAWNPYPYYTNRTESWPRGFPLSLVRSPLSAVVSPPLPDVPLFNGSRIAVIQSLVDRDPDVDAMYRLSPLPLPFYFTEHKDEPPLAPAPHFGMTPYNAQATLHLPAAFFGLLLPVTVHGRVSDIWRSYFTQRILWDEGYTVAFSSPWVEQIRNSHNYLADFKAELDLYERADALVYYLSKVWYPPSDAVTPEERLGWLYVDMFEHGIIQEEDVTLLQAWLQDLDDIGHRVQPSVSVAMSPLPTFPDLELYVRMCSRFHAEFEEKLFMSLRFFWPTSRLLIVLDSESAEDRALGPILASRQGPPASVRVDYLEPMSGIYGDRGKDRMQYDMFNADLTVRSEFVGFLDTDTVFVTQVTRADIFDGDKPVVVGVYGLAGYAQDFWQAVPAQTEWALGRPEVFRGMSYFPVIVRTQHLKEMREYMEKIHGKTFDLIFRDLLERKVYSQFNIIANYVWYFHRDEYSFRLERADGHFPPVRPPGTVTNFTEAGITQEMELPTAKVSTHWDYRTSGPTGKAPLDLLPALREGYCLSYGYLSTPELCTAVPKPEVQEYLFNFEGHSWMYDLKGCLQAHNDHYDEVRRWSNEWSVPILKQIFDGSATTRRSLAVEAINFSRLTEW